MSGYTECTCCGEVIIDRDLCDDCIQAGCRDGECNIPQCEHCDTRATFCTDKRWHSNCDDDCPNTGKVWS